MASDDRTPLYSSAGGNPAEEGTIPFDPAQSPSGKETVSNKAPGAETVKEKPPAEAPLQLSPSMDSTQQQDELDVQSALENSAAKETPPDVPGYCLDEKLGQGTYGVVWRAVEHSTNKQVAIKFFHRRVGEMWQIVWAEIKQLAMLDAVPGIVQLKDAEPDGTPPYFIMNYAEGGSLAGTLRNGAMPVPRALSVFRNMVESMAYVHAKGIRHCDLKPANILLDTLGKPLIADFGQAHLSMESQASSVNLGTFYYMAPEQADLTKQIPDTRWDVYGLGAIFYCMLTGRPPRASTELTDELNQTTHLNSRLQLYQQGVGKAPLPILHRHLPGMDRSLSVVVEKCLHLDPAKRYQSASEVLNALEHRERYLRKRPMLYLGLVASVLLVGCLAALAYALLQVSVHETRDALMTQILHNDKTTAKLIASLAREELSARKDTMERLAKNEELIATIQAFREELAPKSIQDKSYLTTPGFESLETFLFKTHRPGFRLLIYYDAKGNLIVGGHPEATWDDSPAGEAKREKQKAELRKIYGRNYNYRDYYHGLGGNRPNPDGTLKYIERTYVSDPYLSTLEEDGVKPTLVAVSTPIYDQAETTIGKGRKRDLGKAGNKKLIGMLVGFIYFDELHSLLTGVEIHQGSAILLNQHGKCVFHSDLDDSEPLKHKMLKTEKLTKAKGQKQDLNYEDEITGKECLANFAQIEEDGWRAVVLHYREEVFQPIEDMRWTLIKVILATAGICAALLAGVWAWLFRTMRGKDRLRSA